MELSTLGIDLGQDDVSFGRDEPARRSGVAETILSIAALALYREPEGGPNRHGSLPIMRLCGQFAGSLPDCPLLTNKAGIWFGCDHPPVFAASQGDFYVN